MKFFSGLLVAFLLAAPISVSADEKPECGPACAAWLSGHGARPGTPTKCLVTISAPTYGGKVALDVRDAGRASRWEAPRIKQVGEGTVTYKIGCGWLESPTAEVYICVEGKDGKRFTSIRWRKDGDLDEALRTHRLDMCLQGEKCPRYVPGEPPAR